MNELQSQGLPASQASPTVVAMRNLTEAVGKLERGLGVGKLNEVRK